MRIGVALSGGVDSSTSLFLLKQQGHDVFGITIKLTDDYEDKEGSAIWKSRKLCERFGVEHFVLDWSREFQQEVIDNFKRDVPAGITPVPCVLCNRKIKLGKLVDFCREKNAKLATGHYAKLLNGQILRAKDGLKDQTHFLCDVKKECLNDLVFPLSDFLKSEVFRLAQENNLVDVKTYKESQEVCFFNGRSYREYIDDLNISEVEGDILHIKTKKKLGKHSGLLKYTIGQRQGIGIAWTEPLYVVKRDFEKNILYVGEEKLLYNEKLEVKNVNIIADKFIGIEKLSCNVCLRDKTPLIEAEVFVENDNAKIELKTPARAITKGQWCAFYHKDLLIGGGEIC